MHKTTISSKSKFTFNDAAFNIILKYNCDLAMNDEYLCIHSQSGFLISECKVVDLAFGVGIKRRPWFIHALPMEYLHQFLLIYS